MLCILNDYKYVKKKQQKTVPCLTLPHPLYLVYTRGLIGASRSEAYTSELDRDFVYIYMYISVVRHSIYTCLLFQRSANSNINPHALYVMLDRNIRKGELQIHKKSGKATAITFYA